MRPEASLFDMYGLTLVTERKCLKTFLVTREYTGTYLLRIFFLFVEILPLLYGASQYLPTHHPICAKKKVIRL